RGAFAVLQTRETSSLDSPLANQPRSAPWRQITAREAIARDRRAHGYRSPMTMGDNGTTTYSVPPATNGHAAHELTHLRTGIAEATANLEAVVDVMRAVGRATTASDAAVMALEIVKGAFGWTYGAYWK